MSNSPPSIVVPDFTVTADDDDHLNSNSNASSHRRSPSAGLLSPLAPVGAQRSSLDVPSSPTPSELSSNDDTTINVPPSPTLSNASVRFATSTDLRDNNPTAQSGHASYSLLGPPDATNSHRRKPSNATFVSTSDMTEVDSHSQDVDLHHVKTNNTSNTHVNASRSHSKDSRSVDSSITKEKKSKSKSKRSEEDAEDTAHQRADVVDDDLDPAPFLFKSSQLAMMLDPKSLDLMVENDGVDGLLRGLGTNKETGLSGHSLMRTDTRKSVRSIKSTHTTGDSRPGAGGGASHRHDPEKVDKSVPAITLTEPGGQVKRTTSDDHSDDDSALSATLDDRRRIYGPNVLPQRTAKTLLQLMAAAMKDKVLILLTIAAAVSLALGFFQDFGPSRDPEEPPVDWVEGVAIMVAVLIVVIVGSLNDWQKERQFRVLNEKKEERRITVMRDGVEKVIDVKEVVVGDIALFEPGEILPVDGVFLSGHNVRCDESGATGESDAIKKLTFNEVLEMTRKAEKEGKVPPGKSAMEMEHTDCFMISGSKVLEGVGRYVVVAVGTKSFNGRIMMLLRGDTGNTPLQTKLNALAELIAKIGSIAGGLLFAALMIRYFVQLGTGDPPRTANQKGIAFVDIVIIAVTLIVVAVPEGLPLAVTLALAFATKRMTYENLLVRVLGSCETMANASVVCTDKTGTLTQNVMSVVAGSLGIHAKFVKNLEENASRTNADSGKGDSGAPSRKHADDFSLDQSQLDDVMSPALRDLFSDAIALNSTAFEDTDPVTGKPTLIGSKTETALLKFSQEMKWRDFGSRRKEMEQNMVQVIPFSSERKAMACVVKMGDGLYRLFVKGASEILSKKCTSHVVVHKPGDSESSSHNSANVETRALDDLAVDNVSRTIIFYANQMLRTIALCYRDLESWPPAGVELDDQNEVPFEVLARDMTLIAITGIEDPLRDGVREAVSKCQMAGVSVKMCTGDNVLTARSIATQCGIFYAGGIIMEGPVFRKLSPEEQKEIVPRLQVLARSSPEDKKILVECLKSLGEIVGVTGDGTNDGPALKEANVGFSMGIAGTEVAKEASDIILMDDNFASIVKAIIWGRCVNDAVRKFLQFQISTNVTAVIITFVTAVASESESSVLSAVQLLWINIIMDTFAALALATDPASESLLNRKPDKLTAPLFSTDMFKQILFQSTYQIIITLIFHFLGHQILGLEHSKHDDRVIQTLVFNAFVFAQIFNSVNCRRLDRKLNIFEGIIRNYYFITITLLEIAIQVLIVFVTEDAFQVTRIGGREWGISLALGVVSMPLGAVVRLIPSEPFEKFFKWVGLLGKQDALPTLSPEAEEKQAWNLAVDKVRDGLSTYANVRGGRLRSSSFVSKSRTVKPETDVEPFTLASFLGMAPAIMAGAVATRYAEHGNLSDPSNNDPSKSSAALWQGRLQIHPDTPHDDPVYQRFGGDSNV